PPARGRHRLLRRGGERDRRRQGVDHRARGLDRGGPVPGTPRIALTAYGGSRRRVTSPPPLPPAQSRPRCETPCRPRPAGRFFLGSSRGREEWGVGATSVLCGCGARMVSSRIAGLAGSRFLRVAEEGDEER